jgi:hypothetical protein
MSTPILPDLQAALLCEDVRAEVSGQQSLVGIIGMIAAPSLPIGFFKLCLWTRWCGGVGRFKQRSLILNSEDDQPIAQSEVEFYLPGMDAHATNVNVLGGLQFQKFGIYHVEIHLDSELKMRIPLPVVKAQPPQQQPPHHG